MASETVHCPHCGYRQEMVDTMKVRCIDCNKIIRGSKYKDN